MTPKKLSHLFNRIAVQKQLYIIFFIAIFIPVSCIGYYLIYNTRTLLHEHYEKQSYSDNLRVKSLLRRLVIKKCVNPPMQRKVRKQKTKIANNIPNN